MAAIALYPLSFVQEGDQVIIGRPDIDSFAVFPADAAAVVQRLSAGTDPASAAIWYQDTYGEPADIDDFIETLRELGFIRAGAADPAEVPAQAPVRWQRLGAALFSAPALVLYGAAVVAACALMLRVPALRPAPSKVFFTRSLIVITLTTTAAQLAGILWHEWFHILAGRGLGLPSKLSVGRRLNFVVIQTTMTGLMGVPSRKRIVPFLAGLIADALQISLLTALAEAFRLAHGPVLGSQIAVSLVYVTILRMLWQALILMETDLYHVFASAVRCPDLHQMTRTYLWSHLARLRGRPARDFTGDGWASRDLKAVRWYAPFVVVGSLAVLGLVAAGSIPVLAGFATHVYHGVVTRDFASSRFWDSLVTGAAFTAQFALLAVVAIRDRRRRLTVTGSA